MNAPRTLLMAALLGSSVAVAQTPTPVTELCHDTTGQDRQPNFADNGSIKYTSVSIVNDTGTPSLRLNTNLETLNSERIYFPFTQQVKVSYLYESAGNSAALGYFYYKDLVDRGFIDNNGTPDNTLDDKLRDNDGNGVSDFHEALYGMSKTQEYIGGTSRRCSKNFTYSYNGKTYNFWEPELALNGTCDATVRTASVVDASPVVGARGNVSVTLVGYGGSRGGFGNQEYGDKGLYPTIPNLLEPSDPANLTKGLGHLIFLHSDDDGDNGDASKLTPLADSSTNFNGIPDYNVSAYDADGRKYPVAPDNVLDAENDRTVNLGEIEGEREVVFYLVSWGGPNHAPGNTVYPCLGFKPASKICGMHLVSSTSVFFSKTFLNMDQNSVVPVANTVATRDIGCPYGAGPCIETLTDGWLDAPTLTRLKTEPAYNNLVMPHEKASVKADTVSGRSLMPHVLVGAPSTDKYRWILGFEDLPGGGDRDFNDVSFMIHKSNGGVALSAVVSGDLSPSIAQDFTITEVTFEAEDEPYFGSGANAAFCKTKAEKAEDRPRITYQVALDCKICTANCGTTTPTMTENLSPTWVDVLLKEPTPGSPDNGKRKQKVTISDFLARSLTGSQLCWQAVMESKFEQCQPTIRNINVSYKAVRAGDYGRAAVSAVANTVLYGTYETPGRKWFDSATPPSTRVVDGRSDLTDRGHIYLKELFKPETPTATSGRSLWDGGRKLGDDVRSKSPDPLTWRKLYTLDTSDARVELSQVLKDTDGGELFSAFGVRGNCEKQNGGKYLCDLNNSGGPPNDADRALLRNWLYGWEKRTSASTDQKRTWSMGGIQLSTPVIIGGASNPPWWPRATGIEQAAFRDNYLKDARIKERTTMAYVGTTQGFLHGLEAGALKMGDDRCTTATREARGYFATDDTCNFASRNYGVAAERFAYMPRKLLPYYVQSYLRDGNGKNPMVNASPSVADVDLGLAVYNARSGFSRDPKTPQQWKFDGAIQAPLKGAKTVLVSATGPSLGVVVSLDITDPTQPSYPQPMWEFDMGETLIELDSGEKLDVETIFHEKNGFLTPDTRGSRHSPPVVRMDFGDNGGLKWVAVVGTDYVPNPNMAGSVYLVDMKTGKPARLKGTAEYQAVAGVVPLALNEGVAGEPAAVDINEDGSYDLLYVATTKGKIYRISTTLPGPSNRPGQALQVCKIADVNDRLTSASYTDAKYQGVYSTMAVTTVAGDPEGKHVRLFVGTANNPDLSNEEADTATPRPHGYVLGFEDLKPAAKNCTALAKHLWTQQLGVGQLVWGGVTLAGDKVFTTTAVGKAAAACELSETDSGRFYTFEAVSGTAAPGNGTAINGHSLASPVIHDQHVLMLTADGKVMVRGDPAKWNNETEAVYPGPVRVHLWDANATGVMTR